MAEISLFQPNVLRGVIERLETPESYTLLSNTPKSANPFPTANWTVTRNTSNIAVPNVPNSEAHIVDGSGLEQVAASLVYLREKKVFTPTTLHWIKQTQTDGSEITRRNAEEAVLREVKDLNARFDNFAEWMLWRALTGKIEFKFDNYGSAVRSAVDYKFASNHVIDTFAKGWGTATAQEIINDIRTIKAIIQRDSGVPVTDAFVSGKVMDTITKALSSAGATSILSDRMKDEYYSKGEISGLLGINWRVQDAVFDAKASSIGGTTAATAATDRYLAENSVIFGNLKANRPVELLEGPTADDDAPVGYTGKFSKTWKEADPSARQYLLEWNILPAVTRPDQFVYVKNAIGAGA